jgi:3-deoxy-manno-octulosonate cytidylyltransferase (CMP-KDO synthetase)
MTDSNAAIVLIPARLGSTRLPRKVLADIAGAPMIVQVWRRAMEAEVGRVVVACAEPEVAAAIDAAGGTARLTNPDHPSGSDRIAEALQAEDPGMDCSIVVNLQGDLPTIDPQQIRAAVALLDDPAVDIGTVACEITNEEERHNPNVVKIITGFADGARRARALAFTRATAPWGEGPHYHHIGLYAYRRAALERFVALPPSPLERREKLEQLRALDAGMRIDVALVDTVPLGVDTEDDLQRARSMLGGETQP